MNKYKVNVWHTNYGIVEVEAKNSEEAEFKAKKLLLEESDSVITDVFERDYGTAGIREEYVTNV